LNKVIIFFLFFNNFLFFSYGDSRKDIISLNLDYYSLKVDKDKELEKNELLKKEKEKQKQDITQKNIQKRKEIVNEFLKNVSKDIKTTINIKSTYDDNIYLTKENKESAFINTLDMSLKYNPDFIFRKGHTSLSFDINGGPDTNITKKRTFIKGKGNIESILNYKRDKYTTALGFNLKKDYTSSTELKTGAIIPSSLVDYWKRSYLYLFSVDWNRIPMDISYKHSDYVYEKNYKSSNYTDDLISLTNYYKIFPKTKLLSSFDYEVSNSPKKKDARIITYTFWGGIKGKISPKIDGLIKGGYKFENSKSNADINTQTILVNLDYKMATRLFHTIEMEKNLETSVYEDEIWTKTNRFRLYSSYLPAFSKKLRFGSDLSFTNYKYSSNRKDNLYEIGLRSSYLFKKDLTISGGYDFTYKDSSIEDNSYKDNKITVEITKRF